MKCPDCGTTEDIKWFLRHQSEEENDTSDLANVITILCTRCGKNQTYFLRDCLEDIFPDWRDDIDLSNFGSFFAGNFESNLINEGMN